MPFTLGELARRVGGELRGAATRPIRRAAALGTAGEDAISFFCEPHPVSALHSTRAAAVVLSPEDAERYGGDRILVSNPKAAFARIAAALHPPLRSEPGIHRSAVIADSARIASTASVGAYTVVAEGVSIGDEAVIGPNCTIGARSMLGARTRLHANVTLYANCEVGQRCVVHSGAVIGSDGFGYARDGEQWVPLPQLGRVIIGDDVDIGAGTTIDRGTFGDTVIGNRVKLDNQIQIAHNVVIGDDTIMAGCVGVAGSATIGKRCAIGGRANIAGHLEIADDVTITATSFVTRSLRVAGVYSSCIPVQENRLWRRNAARVRRLEELARRVARLEARLDGTAQGEEIID